MNQLTMNCKDETFHLSLTVESFCEEKKKEREKLETDKKKDNPTFAKKFQHKTSSQIFQGSTADIPPPTSRLLVMTKSY